MRLLNIQIPIRDGVGASKVFLPEGPYATILDFLEIRFPRGTRQGWENRMREGRVLNQFGKPVLPDSSYTPKQVLYYYRELKAEAKIPFEENVIYEDEWIVVADKPHFIPVTPIGPYLQETLLVRLRNRLQVDHLSAVHRLDLETAGLVLFTKQAHTRDTYAALFRNRSVKKEYLAVAKHTDQFDWPITHFSRIEAGERFMQMQEVSGTPNSVTNISLIETIHPWALYQLEPITGKKHQLRVHMNALGLPIRGDQIYPQLNDYVLPSQRDYQSPLQLCAKRLSFQDPITGKAHYFESNMQLEWPLTDFAVSNL
jgi:tRNA pseudouridine32 synthase/23S rRNA pseudouridine746 synthase